MTHISDHRSRARLKNGEPPGDSYADHMARSFAFWEAHKHLPAHVRIPLAVKQGIITPTDAAMVLALGPYIKDKCDES